MYIHNVMKYFKSGKGDKFGTCQLKKEVKKRLTKIQERIDFTESHGTEGPTRPKLHPAQFFNARSKLDYA